MQHIELRFDKWIILLIPALVLKICAYILSPFAVLFFSTKDKRNLKFFKWLMTDDNDLTGDDGWKNEHLKGDNPLKTINRIRWLWRNGGHHAFYHWLGIDTPTEYFLCQVTLFSRNLFTVYADLNGYWLYRNEITLPNWLKEIIHKETIELFLGWNLTSSENGKSKYVCTFRLHKD